MNAIKRHRFLFLFGGALLALIASLNSDPDHGLSTALGGLSIAQGIWAVAAAHWARKALMDYPEADWRKLFAKSKESATGAGLALIAVAIMFVGLLMVFSPRAHASELPAGFYKYSHGLKSSQIHYWPSDPDLSILASLIEQESCVSLKSKGCWNPSAKLKTSREEGAGILQITRAYKSNGSLRFDSLASMRDKYSDLSEWSWDNVYTRPDLQLRAVVLLSRDSAMPFRLSGDMLAFGDASYNGGIGGAQRERRACQLTSGCNASLWFKNVENHCLKSRQPIYGGRSACDINRTHTKNVMLIRREKYVIPMQKS
jgi:hypothetical protein